MEKQVTREQFESNKHARTIREHCLTIINTLEALRELGIYPNMHVGKAEETFNDPVMMAEYVAGQIRNAINGGDLIQFHSLVNTTYRFLDYEDTSNAD